MNNNDNNKLITRLALELELAREYGAMIKADLDYRKRLITEAQHDQAERDYRQACDKLRRLMVERQVDKHELDEQVDELIDQLMEEQ